MYRYDPSLNFEICIRNSSARKENDKPTGDDTLLKLHVVTTCSLTLPHAKLHALCSSMIPPFYLLLCCVAATVKHIVMFDFPPSVTDAELSKIKDALLALPKQIPGVLNYELGQDLLLTSGQTHPAGRNRRMCWTATFPTADIFEAYQKHPAHLAFVTDVLKPAMLPGSRAAIQYAVPSNDNNKSALSTGKSRLAYLLIGVAIGAILHVVLTAFAFH